MAKVTGTQSTAAGTVSVTMDRSWLKVSTAARTSSFRRHDGSWSLAMIVKDEADVLARVLEDVSGLCDEMVVVDTGSVDDTKAIARRLGAKVFDFAWTDDFAAARNFSFVQCQGEWILWLDADDRLPPEARDALASLKNELANRPDVSAVKLRYLYAFSAENPDVCIVSHERERLMRRDLGPRWSGAIHETFPVPASRTMRFAKAWVEHRPSPDHGRLSAERNLRVSERQIVAGDRRPNTLWHHARSLQGVGRWEDALVAYQDCLEEGISGWAKYESLESMAVCSERLSRHDDKYRYLRSAVEADSNRAEALFRLGIHHYERQEWEQAMPFFTKATQLTPPDQGIINDEAYGWWAWDYLALCHSELGMYEEALRETDEALRTTTDRERLEANRRFFSDQLAKEQVEPAPGPGLG